MSLILNIDTALATAHVSIAMDGMVIQEAINQDQKEHAAFVQPAIQSIMNKAGIALSAIDAVAVTAGPGSYTGLRVGMASAKGLCYALNKPLIALSTLECMAMAAVLQTKDATEDKEKLLCPMIDARRMEVFTAIYDRSLNVVLPPCALVLEENAYSHYLDTHAIIFFGDGSSKWKNNCAHINASFLDSNLNAVAISLLSFKKYADKNNRLADPAYTEPFYIKEFYTK